MQLRHLLFLLLPILAPQGYAGDIAGAPALVPPDSLGIFSILWNNNIISLEHEPDEYRTQQLGVQFYFSPKWGIVFDYSILTAGQENPVLRDFAGRLDQFSLSLMYELYRNQTESNSIAIVEAGTGFRAYGNFDGRYMQNGFHRLINNVVDDYPYVDTETNMATFWLKGDYQKLYPFVLSDKKYSSWRVGYWLSATGLVSTDHEWDAALTANAVMNNQNMTLWLGVREDWRENYKLDFVQQATALTESGTSLDFGIGVGPVLFEIAHGIGDKYSYTRLILTSDKDEHYSAGYLPVLDNEITLNFLLPDTELELQYRRLLPYREESVGRPSTWMVFGIHYGEPTYDQSFDVYHPIEQQWPIFNVYSEVQQAVVGVELEWNRQHRSQKLWPYVALLAGYRSEQLKVNSGAYSNVLEGQESEKVSSTVVEAAAGIRFGMYSQQKWRLLFQVGVVGNYPLSSETVTLEQNYLEVLQPNLMANLGIMLNFDF